MKNYSDVLRDIAASMVVEASFYDNVVQTWKSPSVRRSVPEFIKKFTPYIDRLKEVGERYIDIKSIFEAVKKGTEGKIFVNPSFELVPFV